MGFFDKLFGRKKNTMQEYKNRYEIRKKFINESGLFDIVAECYKLIGVSTNMPYKNKPQEDVQRAILDTAIEILVDMDVKDLSLAEFMRVFSLGWGPVMGIFLEDSQYECMAQHLINNYLETVVSIMQEHKNMGL